MSCDTKRELATTAALEWLKDNTTVPVNLEDPEVLTSLPASAQMFVQKYVEILTRSTGVASQSIEGLSLSYGNTDVATQIWQIANMLLAGKLKSQVRVFPAKRRW